MSKKGKKEERVKKLIEQLKDEDEEVRRGVAEALGEIGEKAVPALIEGLKEEDWRVRLGVALALKVIGKQGVPALVEALKEDKEAVVRYEVAMVLGLMGEPAKEAVPALITILQKDENVEVRGVAVLALGLMGEYAIEAIPALIEALRDEEGGVRVGAAVALASMREKAAEAVPALIEALKDEEEMVRWWAVWALGRIGEKAVPALKEVMIKDEDKLVREQAVMALETISAKLGYRNHKELLRASMTEEERRAETIGEYIDQLDSLNLQNRKVAAYKLGELQAAEAIEPLAKLLDKKRENTWLRAFAVWALGEIGTDKAIRMLKIIEKPKALVEYVIKGALLKLDEEYRNKISPEEKKRIEEYEAELKEEAKKVILSPPRESWFARKGKELFTIAIVEGVALIGTILGLIVK